MISLCLYLVFSYLFMIGSAVADSESGNQSALTYLVGVFLAPVTFPFALGFALTSK